MTVNLLDFDAGGLARFLAVQGEASDRANMRARQLIQWIHQRGVTDFDGMTDVAKSLRARLAEVAAAAPPPPLRQTVSDDGTRKWLLDVGGANAVETVFIPEDGRGTLCVSSQAGCALECSFCATGKQGFSRNLSAAEIIGQLWHAKQALGDFGAGDSQQRIISNVVMMGMGEPLANLDNVIVALKLMLDDHAYGLSRRRVTVSTSGLVPAIDRLRDACPVALAVSLHAPDDALRDELVPINRKYPLTELMAACRRYLERSPRDFITFEYVMIDGVNDGDAQARALLALTREVPCKFNLIPFNSFPGSAYRRSSNNRIRAFQERLMAAQVVATVRKTRGDDVDAACGQLAGQVRDRTRRGQRLVQMAQVHS